MNAIRHLTAALLLGALVLVASGCGKKEEAAPVAPPAPTVTMPTTNENEAWKAYFRQEVKPYVDRRFRRPFTYLIPSVDSAAADAAEQQALYDRQVENVENAVARGIQAGTMLAFAGPDSVKVADAIERAFELAGPKSLKGVRVVVIVNADVRPRIEAAVKPTDAELVFVDPK